MIYVLNFRESAPDNSIEINTTSRSNSWSKGLSPFILVGGKTWTGDFAYNVENMWQYSKVYPIHTTNKEPNDDYYKWAKDGWNSKYANRYPMGKNARPLYSIWKNQKLEYLEAKEKLYIPMYYRSVINTEAFDKLKELYKECLITGKNLVLRDFDAYNHHELKLSYKEVVRNPKKKFGHAFVLAMILEDVIKIEKNNLIIC